MTTTQINKWFTHPRRVVASDTCKPFRLLQSRAGEKDKHILAHLGANKRDIKNAWPAKDTSLFNASVYFALVQPTLAPCRVTQNHAPAASSPLVSKPYTHNPPQILPKKSNKSLGSLTRQSNLKPSKNRHTPPRNRSNSPLETSRIPSKNRPNFSHILLRSNSVHIVLLGSSPRPFDCGSRAETREHAPTHYLETSSRISVSTHSLKQTQQFKANQNTVPQSQPKANAKRLQLLTKLVQVPLTVVLAWYHNFLIPERATGRPVRSKSVKLKLVHRKFN